MFVEPQSPCLMLSTERRLRVCWRTLTSASLLYALDSSTSIMSKPRHAISHTTSCVRGQSTVVHTIERQAIDDSVFVMNSLHCTSRAYLAHHPWSRAAALSVLSKLLSQLHSALGCSSRKAMCVAAPASKISRGIIGVRVFLRQGFALKIIIITTTKQRPKCPRAHDGHTARGNELTTQAGSVAPAEDHG